MSHPFLSEEYLQAGTQVLAKDPEVQKAIDGVDVSLQFEVKDGPEGDFSYYMRIAEGQVEMGRGSVGSASATIRNSYDTAARLARRDLSNQVAFLTGKVKISGSLGVLMKHNALLDLIQERLGRLDTIY